MGVAAQASHVAVLLAVGVLVVRDVPGGDVGRGLLQTMLRAVKLFRVAVVLELEAAADLLGGAALGADFPPLEAGHDDEGGVDEARMGKGLCVSCNCSFF